MNGTRDALVPMRHQRCAKTRPTCTADHWPLPRAVGIFRSFRPFAMARRLVAPASRSVLIVGAISAALAFARFCTFNGSNASTHLKGISSDPAPSGAFICTPPPSRRTNAAATVVASNAASFDPQIPPSLTPSWASMSRVRFSDARDRHRDNRDCRRKFSVCGRQIGTSRSITTDGAPHRR